MEHRELTNTLCFPLTASWTVRIRVLGRLGTLLFKRISRIRSVLSVSAVLNLVGFSKRTKIVSVLAFVLVLSKRFIGLLKWELGGFLDVGYILDITTSGSLVHLGKSDRGGYYVWCVTFN